MIIFEEPLCIPLCMPYRSLVKRHWRDHSAELHSTGEQLWRVFEKDAEKFVVPGKAA
jgi:ABC-type uncharacterized transport system permease subunit